MQKDFLVESRSYDQMLRGSWHACHVEDTTGLSDERTNELSDDCIALWLPAGTPMRWATGTRPLRSNCLQLFWPRRWYMLSAFYNDRTLIHTYANVIQPAAIILDRISYVDLDLSILVKPDMTFEVLTQVEFEQAADTLHYDEQTRISALMAMESLTSAMQLSIGVFASIPHRLARTDFHLAHCQ